MAKSYHRPLLTFYLATPPQPGERGVDFRQPVGASPVLEPEVDALVRDVRSRQSMVRATLIADVCQDLNIRHCNIWKLIKELDFRTSQFS